MAYPQSRSCVSELHQGVHEGCVNTPGKDWGGVPGNTTYPAPVHICGPGCPDCVAPGR